MEITDPVGFEEIARRATKLGIVHDERARDTAGRALNKDGSVSKLRSMGMSRQRVYQLWQTDPHFPKELPFKAGNMRLFEWSEVLEYLRSRDNTTGRRKGWNVGPAYSADRSNG